VECDLPGQNRVRRSDSACATLMHTTSPSNQARHADRKGKLERYEANLTKTETKKKEKPDANAKRQVVYEWYIRCGMPEREKMKKKIRNLPAGSGLTQSDVDLLPWSECGTRIDITDITKTEEG